MAFIFMGFVVALATAAMMWQEQRQRGKSQVVALGTGFIAFVVISGLAMGAYLAYSAWEKANEPIPASFAEAKLDQSRDWTDEQYRMAARITLARLEEAQAKMEEAAERGDQMAIVNASLSFVKQTGDWPSFSTAEQEKWRPCLLAKAYLLGYLERPNQETSRFISANAKACGKLI